MMSGRLFLGAAGLTGLLLAAAAQTEKPVVSWDIEGEAAFSVGYKDNVLLSSIAEESSGFFRSTADVSAMRFTETGSFLMFYLFGEDTRYIDAPSVNYEQFFSGVINGAAAVGSDDMLGLEASYLYQRQVYDASETQENQRRLLVLGNSAAVRPYWEHDYGNRWEHRFDFGIFRQYYEEDLDDYLEAGGKFTVVRQYGHRSEWSVAYQYVQRYYDTREQFDESGFIIPDTDLIYVQQELLTVWRHYFDRSRNWRSQARLSGMMNQDNGSGYFDYDRILLREELRWDNGTWVVKGNARFGWYFYDIQTVGDEARERSYISLDMRVERWFGNHTAVFGEGGHEWDASNDPLDEYTTWTIYAGIILSI